MEDFQIKMMVDINGNLYDIGSLKSIEKGYRYADEYLTPEGELLENVIVHSILLNRKSSEQQPYHNTVIDYPNKEDRDKEIQNVKNKLANLESVMFL